MEKEKIYTPTRIRKIEEAISKASGVSIDDMRGKSRQRNICDARCSVWIVAKDYLKYSYVFMGKIYHRDHTTIMNGVEKMRKLKALDGLIEGIKRVYPDAFNFVPEPGETRPYKSWNF